MQVKILKGQRSAVDLRGKKHKIEGIKITKDQGQRETIHLTSSPFYLAAAAVNTNSNAYTTSPGKIMLL
jgi:hypothetical protein